MQISAILVYYILVSLKSSEDSVTFVLVNLYISYFKNVVSYDEMLHLMQLCNAYSWKHDNFTF